MIDRILAVLGLLGVIAFLGIIITWVPEIDLIIIVVLVIVLAAFDFWRTLR